MDEFLLQALIAGLLLAAITGPLGALVVWRHLAYFGDTIAHAALLGVAVSLIAEFVPMTLAMFLVALAVALLLTLLTRDARFHADTMLGLLAHGTLAVGVLLVAVNGTAAANLEAYLFGDILAVTPTDLALLAILLLVVLFVFFRYGRQMLLMTVDQNIASVEGVPVARRQLLLLMLFSATIALSIKIVGVLLITAMLIIPAAAARFLARTPWGMMAGAAFIGAVSTSLGLYGALLIDAPAAPMMVSVSVAMFLVLAVLSRVFQRLAQTGKARL
jgi:zinc transport system permease protein